MWGKNQLFLFGPSYLTSYVCSPNHNDLKVKFMKVKLHELAVFIRCALRFISVAVRISRPKSDSKPTPNSDMTSCNLIKKSLIFFKFQKD